MSLQDSNALDIIAELIEQHCWSNTTPAYDSGFITINANAMRFLAEHGRFEIISDDGGRNVYGTVIWP